MSSVGEIWRRRLVPLCSCVPVMTQGKPGWKIVAVTQQVDEDDLGH